MTTQYAPIDGIEPELADQILGDESDLEPEQHPSASANADAGTDADANANANANADATATATATDDVVADYLKAVAQDDAEPDAQQPDIQSIVNQAVSAALQGQQQQQQQSQPQETKPGQDQKPQANPEHVQSLRDAQVAMIDATRPLFEDEATYNNFREMALRGEVTQDAMQRWQATAQQRSAAQRTDKVAENVEDLNRKVSTMMAMQAAAMRQAQNSSNAGTGAGIDPNSQLGVGALLDARAMSDALGVPFDASNPTAQNFMLQGITPNMNEDQARAIVKQNVQRVAQAQAQPQGQPQAQAQAQPQVQLPPQVQAQMPPNTANSSGGITGGGVLDPDALTDAVLDPNGMSDQLWEYCVENSSALLRDDL